MPEHDENQHQVDPAGDAKLPTEQVHYEDVDATEYDPDAEDEDGHAEDDGQ